VTRLTIKMHVPEAGTRFGPGCFDKQVGKEIPFEIREGEKVPAVLKAYRIVDAGLAVEFDLELK